MYYCSETTTMFSFRPTRSQADYIEALDWQQDQPFAPDGLGFWDVLHIQSAAYVELRRTKVHPPTSWMRLDEDERAAIRSRRRLRVAQPAATRTRATETESAA